MDFAKLIEPYKENDRTPEGQIKWLLGKGILRDKVDQAMLIVYDELERGKVFESGHELDRYLLEITEGLVKVDLDESVKKLETFFNSLLATHKDKWQEELKNTQKPRVLARIKAVFKP
jgi:hypothetical protein